MTAVAVTGAGGFFGWHIRARLHAAVPDAEVRLIDRDAFADDAVLASRLKGVDTVVHLAGANRGPADEVYETNVWLARKLVEALDSTKSAAQVVFANSIHSEGDSPYGRSKGDAAKVLDTWARLRGARFADLVLPNLFGECGRPNYNSAVATFCHDLATGRESVVNPDGHTELLHVQDACASVLDVVACGESGRRRVAGQALPITEVYARLRRLHDGYHAASVPKLCDRLDLQLFNALRTAMFPARYPMALGQHRDARGAFVELARGHGESQTSFSTTAPGVTRGEHYHLEKIERFVVVRGRATIKLRRLFDHQVFTFDVDGTSPVVVDMPPLFAHNITNVGDDDLLTIFWANDHFDPNRPDTFPEVVEPITAGAAA